MKNKISTINVEKSKKINLNSPNCGFNNYRNTL